MSSALGLLGIIALEEVNWGERKHKYMKDELKIKYFTNAFVDAKQKIFE